jgi:hypothetical protein
MRAQLLCMCCTETQIYRRLDGAEVRVNVEE